MKVFTTIVFLCFLSFEDCFALESRPIGNVDIQLRSRAEANENEVLLEVISISVAFLDETFENEFANSQHQFSRAGLSVDYYDISPEVTDNENVGYVGTITISGTAFFEEGSNPTNEDVLAVTSKAFQENNKIFLQKLMGSSEPFLQNLSYAIVRVNGSIIANDSTLNKNGNTTEPWVATWVIALLAGVGAFVCVLSLCFCFICCTSTDEEMDERPHVDLQKSTSRTTGTASFNREEDVRSRSASPSGLRSMMSQDSSQFTYNPRSTWSRASYDSNTIGSYTQNIGTTSDIESWQKGSTVPESSEPFGHDISAIDTKKDLSLSHIQETEVSYDQVESQTHSRAPQKNQSTTNNFHSSDQQHEKSRPNRSHKSSSSAKRADSDDESAVKVMNDLEALSEQINRYRFR